MSSVYDDPIGEIILKHEGGFVNDPTDRGGATNLGITQQTLTEWRGKPVSVEDVRNLTEAEAREIYTERYLKQPKIDRLPFPYPQVQVMDIGVNSGPRRAVKFLQEVLNASGFPCGRPDGVIGPKTIAATEQAHEQMGAYLDNALVDRRKAFYEAIMANDPSQERFRRGWMRRAESFRREV